MHLDRTPGSGGGFEVAALATFTEDGSGEVNLAGEAHGLMTFFPVSNFAAEGGGGGLLGGAAHGLFVFFQTEFSFAGGGSASVGGDAHGQFNFVFPFSPFTYPLVGGFQIGGAAHGHFTFLPVSRFAASGSGPVFQGSFGSTPAFVEIVFDQWFLWNVLSRLEIDRVFQWGMDDSVLYWFQVDSCCEPTTCEDFIIDDGGKCGGVTMITTILAPNVADVCRQLTDRGLNVKICSIRQFTQAPFIRDRQLLESQGISQDCNQLVDVSFCELPQCLDLCIDFDAQVSIDLVADSPIRTSTSGGVVVSGHAVANRVFVESGRGGVVLSGSAAIVAQLWGATAAGGVILGGQAGIVSSAWSFAAGGGVVTGGNASVTSTSSTFRGSGQVLIGGTVATHVTRNFDFPIFGGGPNVLHAFGSTGSGPSGPSFAGVTIAGAAATSQSVPTFPYLGTGGCLLAGAADVVAQHRTFAGAGGAVVSGSPELALGQWAYQAVCPPGIDVSGSAWSEETLVGLSLSSLSIGDPASTDVDLGLYAALLSAEVSMRRLFGLEGGQEGVPPIPLNSETIRTRCDCNAISTILHLEHNLAGAGRLREFLFRNEVDLPSTVAMNYNGLYRAWQANIHLSGLGPDGLAPEVWNMVFDWQCTSSVGGTDLGSPVWKLGMLFSVGRIDTRVLMTFAKVGPCQDGAIRFEVALDTDSGIATTDPDHRVYSVLLSDSLGMFRSSFWRQRPILDVIVAEQEELTSVQHIPYYNSIFPEV